MDHSIARSQLWIVEHLQNDGKIDETDAIILRELLRDARSSWQSIANKADVSRPTINDRINKLGEKNIIDKYTLKLNYSACGLPLKVFILVAFDAQSAALHDTDITQRIIAQQLTAIKHVLRVNIITGSHDFLVEVAIDTMENLTDLIIEKMRKIPGIGQTQTLISFAEYQNAYRPSIDPYLENK